MRYVSGAYADDCWMSPVNSQLSLRVVIQGSFEHGSTIELSFKGLKYLHLIPVEEGYSCDIFHATMKIENDTILWYDCQELNGSELEKYKGTVICASRVYWRALPHITGNKIYYKVANEFD